MRETRGREGEEEVAGAEGVADTTVATSPDLTGADTVTRLTPAGSTAQASKRNLTSDRARWR